MVPARLDYLVVKHQNPILSLAVSLGDNMGAGTETQKEVTEKFRNNWDEIFRKVVAEKQHTPEQLELDLTNKED